MKKNLLFLLLTLPLAATWAQQINYDTLAKNIATKSIGIKAGETVYIYGDQNAVPLMEALGKVCETLGAKHLPKLNPDKFQGTESMNNFLTGELSPPEKLVEWLNTADACIILTPFDKEPRWLFKDITATVADAQQTVIREALLKSHTRILYVTYPTRAFAEGLSLNYDAYEQMTWKAITTHNNDVEKLVKRLKGLLANAKQVRITTTSGTNLTFSIAGRAAAANDGAVTEAEAASRAPYNKLDRLPADMVEVSIAEHSANGKVIVPLCECDYDAVTQATLTFVNGKIQTITAKTGADCLKGKFAAQDASVLLGSVSFGFNADLKPMNTGGALYWPRATAGMVTLTTGSNQFLGGKNDIRAVQFNFPLADVNLVEIDGKVALKKP
ncbi:aminopeptidase [Chryseolinea lacunae]|uniref:Aminopeptidase n=1 Tax=Chryseolinea lacunae TaxID=2801331 RepID=A0ABS1KXU8_9BACT|nr:aminopeptidase [Chryseolinea lacunae]MBL0744077.1 aminopeptidase [Chryseolinea lacunae]